VDRLILALNGKLDFATDTETLDFKERLARGE